MNAGYEASQPWGTGEPLEPVAVAPRTRRLTDPECLAALERRLAHFDNSLECMERRLWLMIYGIVATTAVPPLIALLEFLRL